MTDAFLTSLKTVINLVSYFLIIFGLAYLFLPKFLEELNKFVNKILFHTDQWAFANRVLIGLGFILIAFFLLLIVNLKL